MKRITDKNFKYVPSHETNLRKTFDRVRREQQVKLDQQQIKVTPIKRVKTG